MSTITKYLDEIAVECAKLGIDLKRDMLPGITLDRAAKVAKDLQFDLPNEIIELYLWKNGVRLEGQSCENRMIPRFYVRPLEQCVHTTKILISGIHEPNSQWRAKWFSVFEDLAGDYLAINCKAGDIDYGKIFSVEELVEPFPAFLSLEVMLYSVLECYRSGAYFIDEDGLLAEDDEIADPIYRRFNCGLSPCYWKKELH
jgi:hypothetical protein